MATKAHNELIIRSGEVNRVPRSSSNIAQYNEVRLSILSLPPFSLV